jgi:hypothetical protein
MTKTDKEIILTVLSQMDEDVQYHIDTMIEQQGESSITRIDDLLDKMLDNKLVSPAYSRYVVMRTQKGISLNSYSYDKIFPPRKALAEEILEYLYPTYFNGAFVNITDLVLDHSPQITGSELRNILMLLVQAKYIQDNPLYSKVGNPAPLKKMIETAALPFVNAKMTPEGYEHIQTKNNMTEKNSNTYHNLTIKMGDQGIANFGANSVNTINNNVNKGNLIEALKEIKGILAESRKQDQELVESVLTAIEKENTLDFGLIGKVLELCSNGATVLEFGQKIASAGIKLALATGVFST